MKAMNKEDIKTNFPEEEIDIIDAQKKELLASLIPKPTKKTEKRKIGLLDGKGKIEFSSDFKMTEEEFLNL